jgi:hypothetical protein
MCGGIEEHAAILVAIRTERQTTMHSSLSVELLCGYHLPASIKPQTEQLMIEPMFLIPLASLDIKGSRGVP